MTKEVITHQAFVQSTPTSVWVYCKWNDGTITRYLSVSRIGSDGLTSFDTYPDEEVKSEPVGLDWRRTGK